MWTQYNIVCISALQRSAEVVLVSYSLSAGQQWIPFYLSIHSNFTQSRTQSFQTTLSHGPSFAWKNSMKLTFTDQFNHFLFIQIFSVLVHFVLLLTGWVDRSIIGFFSTRFASPDLRHFLLAPGVGSEHPVQGHVHGSVVTVEVLVVQLVEVVSAAWPLEPVMTQPSSHGTVNDDTWTIWV